MPNTIGGAFAGAGAGNIKPSSEPIKNMPNVAQGLANYLAGVARTGAGAQANAAGFASQAAQGAFNQQSADNANYIGDYRIADQMGYNSAMWQQAADWNEMMFNRAMAFNAEQAELNRKFQKEMDSTKYQRAIQDMETAGLNPIMAVTGGGISVGGGTGSYASVGAPSMSSASSGLINGVSASEGNFAGHMDYLSGILGLLGGAIAGASSAFKNLAGLANYDGGIGKFAAEMLNTLFSKETGQEIIDTAKQGYRNTFERKNYKGNYRNGIDWNMKDYSNKSGYYG